MVPNRQPTPVLTRDLPIAQTSLSIQAKAELHRRGALTVEDAFEMLMDPMADDGNGADLRLYGIDEPTSNEIEAYLGHFPDKPAAVMARFGSTFGENPDDIKVEEETEETVVETSNWLDRPIIRRNRS